MKPLFGRIFLSVFVFLLHSFLLSAQHFQGGIMAGLNASQISGDQLSGFNKAGLIFGGFTRLPLKENQWAEFQLIYIQKGSAKQTSENDLSQYSLTLDYIEAPILYKVSKRNLLFQLGICLGALFKETEKDEYGIIPARPGFEKYDFSYIFGVGYRFFKHTHLDMRFSRSALAVRGKGLTASYHLDRLQYNSCLLFTLSYTFGHEGE